MTIWDMWVNKEIPVTFLTQGLAEFLHFWFLASNASRFWSKSIIFCQKMVYKLCFLLTTQEKNQWVFIVARFPLAACETTSNLWHIGRFLVAYRRPLILLTVPQVLTFLHPGLTLRSALNSKIIFPQSPTSLSSLVPVTENLLKGRPQGQRH